MISNHFRGCVTFLRLVSLLAVPISLIDELDREGFFQPAAAETSVG